MANTEKLKFRLELWAEYWDKPPVAEIFINNHSHFKGEIFGSEKDPILIEFDHTLEEGQKYNLIIRRTNKDSKQTVLENGKITKDQLLHIKSIEIDEIDVGGLVFEGIYTPEYPEPWASQQRTAGVNLETSFKNVTCMGHNGEWSLSFESPFYMWLLENLY